MNDNLRKKILEYQKKDRAELELMIKERLESLRSINLHEEALKEELGGSILNGLNLKEEQESEVTAEVAVVSDAYSDFLDQIADSLSTREQQKAVIERLKQEIG